MKAEIMAVGTELLLGDILNTNAQYLSKQLALLGIEVYYIFTLVTLATTRTYTMSHTKILRHANGLRY